MSRTIVINGLILRARGYMFRCETGQKTIGFLFTRQMRWKPFEVVAMSPESGAVTPFRGECRMLPPDHFRKSPHRVVPISFGRLFYTNC